MASLLVLLCLGGGAGPAPTTAPSATTPSATAPAATATPATEEGHPASTLCGINVVYSAGKYLGKPVDYARLLDKKYISSFKGSSVDDIEEAAVDQGLYAQFVANLTPDSLLNLRQPIILYVRQDASSSYDHWVLCLGSRRGRLLIYDPPEPVREVLPGELLPVWGGAGVLVSDQPFQASNLSAAGRREVVVYIALALAVVIAVHWLTAAPAGDGRAPGRYAVRQSALLVTAAVAVALTLHFLGDGRFFSSPQALAAVEAGRMSDLLPSIDVDEAKRLHASGVVFVDARESRDFASNHIPGAINIPPGIAPGRIPGKLATVRPSDRIVVYCQNRTCRYGENLAVLLVKSGFTNLTLFPDGWEAWKGGADTKGPG